MSRRAINRQIKDAKLAGIQDAAVRLTEMMKSPYRRHRRKATEMGNMVAKMQDLIAEKQEEV